MRNREDLIAAVERAMAALEEVKNALEAERLEAADAVPEPEASAGGTETRVTPEGEIPVYSAVRNMRGAAQLAAERCREWQYRDEAGLPVDNALLLFSCEEEDRKNGLDPLDARSYYIVSPEGAIGCTSNDGENVEWIFVPTGTCLADMPDSLGSGTTPAPAPSASSTAPAVDPETRFCRGCGAPLRKGDLFCMKCGHRVES